MSCYKNSQHIATKKSKLINPLFDTVVVTKQGWSLGMDKNPYYLQVPLKTFTDTKKMKLLILQNLYKCV